MSRLTGTAKRLLVGRPFRNDRLGQTLLPKRIALPVFASDAMSSVAYAPQELFATLSVAGLAAYAYSWWIAGLVCLVMLVVVASYRQNVHAYPGGGGDYEVASVNLGPNAGLLVASALSVDYILTVAVSASSGVANIGSAIPLVARHPVASAVVLVLLIAILNLRGARESGLAFAVPVYLFLGSMLAMLATGIVRWLAESPMRAESADYDIPVTHSLSGFALLFLLLRAFSTGSAALTGVEAISNGVPAFRQPKSRNAAATLAMMGLLAVTMIAGLVALARITEVHIVETGGRLIGAPDDYLPKTLIAQIADAVFSGFAPAFYLVSFATGLILILACNTAFNGFPALGSVLARDSYLPRQLGTRGDRLAFSNGIVFLTVIALLLIAVFRADVTALIQLYIVGVFVSFTLSQAGMLRHWHRELRSERDRAARRRIRRSQTINAIGLCLTAVVLVIVLITKFLAGAWIAVAAMAALFALMKAIRRHYDRVAVQLAADEDDMVLPSRIHGIVLISQLHLPAMRALAYARAIRADTLEAVIVNIDPEQTARVAQEFADRQIPVQLKVIDSPFREVTRPIVDYVRRVRKDTPRDLITVFIPEYVVGHWWEQLLHNQTALRLKGRLLFTPGVMVTSVPWQLHSTEALHRRMRDIPVAVPLQQAGRDQPPSDAAGTADPGEQPGDRSAAEGSGKS